MLCDGVGERMKLNWIKGMKSKTDRIITITSDKEKEWISMFKLALLVNQIAINELKIKEEKGYDNFLFKPAIIDSIEMAEKQIDWGEEKNIKEVMKWCKRHHLKFEWIEKLKIFSVVRISNPSRS